MGDTLISRAAAMFRKAPVAEPALKPVEEVKVDEVAQDVTKAAEATIKKAPSLKGFAKAKAWYEAKKAEAKAGLSEAGSKVSQASKKAFGIKSKTELAEIKTKAEEAKAQEEAASAKKEKVAEFKSHAKELYQAIRGFENIDPKTNEYSTAKKRFDKAVKVLVADLSSLDGQVSRDEFLAILNAAVKDSNARVFADSRYGSAFEKVNKSVSVPNFIRVLIASRTEASQKAYDSQIASLAKKFAKALKEIRNNDDATRFNHDRFQAIRDLAETKEYKNLLGADKEKVAKDLDSQIVATLGGKKAVLKLIAKIDSIIASPFDFHKAIASKKSAEEKRVASMLKKMDTNLADLYKRLDELADQENDFAKIMLNLLEIVRNPEETEKRRQDAEAEIAEINNERMLIQEEINRLSGDVDFTKAEKARTLESFGAEYLCNLNAQARELARAIGVERKDVETLPREATRMDTVKRYSKNAAIYGGIPTAILAGAAAGYYYYDPVTATWLATSARDGVVSGAGFVYDKAGSGASFVATNAKAAGSVIAATAGNVKGYVASTRFGQLWSAKEEVVVETSSWLF